MRQMTSGELAKEVYDIADDLNRRPSYKITTRIFDNSLSCLINYHLKI